jgi:hypothetical protein
VFVNLSNNLDRGFILTYRDHLLGLPQHCQFATSESTEVVVDGRQVDFPAENQFTIEEVISTIANRTSYFDQFRALVYLPCFAS